MSIRRIGKVDQRVLASQTVGSTTAKASYHSSAWLSLRGNPNVARRRMVLLGQLMLLAASVAGYFLYFSNIA